MYNIYIVSDSIGETADQIIKAAVSQFDVEYEVKRYSYISNSKQLEDILYDASKENSIVIFTVVVPELRSRLIEIASDYNIPVVDLMHSVVDAFSSLFNQEPSNEPGLIRRLDDKYFRKVEAIEFAVKYDDGKNVRGLREADVVIIGVSRTSKTPLCMYLAHKNIKAANIPLVPEVPVSDEFFKVNKKKIIGLTTNPIKLNEIRQERLNALGLSNDANYASMERILKELDYAEEIMKKIGCPIIDVSVKAVEETASIIFEIMNFK